MNEESEREVELKYKIAEAKFGVADELGWATGVFAAAAIYSHWESWILSLVSGVLVFFLATYRERKEYKAACADYEH